MSHCCFISNINDQTLQCKMKSKYGDYCYKHRKNYLLTKDGNIDISRFTGVRGDYLKDDLFRYYRKTMNNRSLVVSSSKDDLFKEVSTYIQNLKEFKNETEINQIIKIQSIVRGRLQRTKLKNIKCNNNEDFYTYDSITYSPSSSATSLVHNVKLSLNNCIIKVESLYDSSSNVSKSVIASSNAVRAKAHAFVGSFEIS